MPENTREITLEEAKKLYNSGFFAKTKQADVIAEILLVF